MIKWSLFDKVLKVQVFRITGSQKTLQIVVHSGNAQKSSIVTVIPKTASIMGSTQSLVCSRKEFSRSACAKFRQITAPLGDLNYSHLTKIVKVDKISLISRCLLQKKTIESETRTKNQHMINQSLVEVFQKNDKENVKTVRRHFEL